MTFAAATGQAARRARTRERLMDAASDLFAENGFSGSSLDMICERAGLTRGAFHYNFSNREELFLSVMQRGFDETLVALEALGGSTPGHQPEELIDLLVAFYSTRGQEFVAWSRLNEEFRLHAMRDPAAAEAYTEYFRVVHQKLAFAITQAAESKGARLLAPAETVAAIFTGTFLQAVSDGILASLDDGGIQRLAMDRMFVILHALMPSSRRSRG